MDLFVQTLDRCESYKLFQQTFERFVEDLSAQEKKGLPTHLVDLIKKFCIWKTQIPVLIQETGQALTQETKSWADQGMAKKTIEFWNERALLASSASESSVERIKNQILVLSSLQPKMVEQLTEIINRTPPTIEFLEAEVKSSKDPEVQNKALKNLLHSQRLLLGATALLPLLQQAVSARSSQT